MGGGNLLASLRLCLTGGLSSLEGDGGRGGGGGGDRGGVNRVVGSVTGMAHCVPLMIDRQLAPLSSIYMVEEPEHWVQIRPKGAVSAVRREVQAWVRRNSRWTMSEAKAAGVPALFYIIGNSLSSLILRQFPS